MVVSPGIREPGEGLRIWGFLYFKWISCLSLDWIRVFFYVWWLKTKATTTPWLNTNVPKRLTFITISLLSFSSSGLSSSSNVISSVLGMLPRTSSETLTGSYAMLPHKTFFYFCDCSFSLCKKDVELQGEEEGGRRNKERKKEEAVEKERRRNIKI